jgi:hypothetical protein
MDGHLETFSSWDGWEYSRTLENESTMIITTTTTTAK